MQIYLTLPHEQIQVHLPLQAFLLSEVTNTRSLSKFLAVNTCLFLSVAINFNSEREYFAIPTAIIVRSEIASNEISSKDYSPSQPLFGVITQRFLLGVALRDDRKRPL